MGRAESKPEAGWRAFGPRALCVMACLLAGCQGSGGGPLARWRMVRDDSLAKPPTAAEVGDDRNFLARFLNPSAPPSNVLGVDKTLVLGSDGWTPLKAAPPDPVSEASFNAALEQFQAGDLAEAEEEFARLAKKKKGTNWGEKAQFYLAETQYQRGRYVASHESFERLIADYPGTKHLEESVAREYAIAINWMASLQPEADAKEKLTMANWWKGRHPAIDVSGNTLAVLEHVRHHDPLGPLADDAVMRIADYHFQQGDYEQASIYYDQLISEHPKSDLAPKAHLASIDSKIKGYIGPEYDGGGLEQARELAMQTMMSYPEQRASYSEEMDKTLAVIDEQMAERAYQVGEHYLWTGKVTSAEYCFGEIPARWPKSPYAAQAKEQLAKIALMPRKETKASTIMTRPGTPDPASMGGAGAGGMGAGGMGGGGMGGMGGGGMGGMGGP